MTYAFDHAVEPIDQWPGERTRWPGTSPFKASLTATQSLLSNELRMLGATEVVLQLDIERRHLRVDGSLRADARPRSGAVILNFTIAGSRDGKRPTQHLQFAMDAHDKYQDNLRAIALTLQSLRAIDRYGVTKGGQQYQGWAKLTAPARDMSPSEAATCLAMNCSLAYSASELLFAMPSPSHADKVRDAYRIAARHLHPDMPGGDERLFKKVTAARDILLSNAAAVSR